MILIIDAENVLLFIFVHVLRISIKTRPYITVSNEMNFIFRREKRHKLKKQWTEEKKKTSNNNYNTQNNFNVGNKSFKRNTLVLHDVRFEITEKKM